MNRTTNERGQDDKSLDTICSRAQQAVHTTSTTSRKNNNKNKGGMGWTTQSVGASICVQQALRGMSRRKGGREGYNDTTRKLLYHENTKQIIYRSF